MSMSDPIADMLTRIRNGQMAGHRSVTMPYSSTKHNIARVLIDEGYVVSAAKSDHPIKAELTIQLKYISAKPRPEPVIHHIKRISRPGLRIYRGKGELPKVQGGFGTLIVSTPKGIVSSKKAKVLGVGGELLCEVY